MFCVIINNSGTSSSIQAPKKSRFEDEYQRNKFEYLVDCIKDLTVTVQDLSQTNSTMLVGLTEARKEIAAVKMENSKLKLEFRRFHDYTRMCNSVLVHGAPVPDGTAD